MKKYFNITINVDISRFFIKVKKLDKKTKTKKIIKKNLEFFRKINLKKVKIY